MKIKLYHGTLYDFDFFDENFLGGNIKDLLSFLGFHFTKEKSLARTLFAFDATDMNREGQIITIEIEENENNSISFTESELVLKMLEFGVSQNLVTDYYYKKISKLPYWDSFGGDSITRSLYNNGKRKKSPNYINKKELAFHFKQYLLSQGIEIIKYKNEIEWSQDNRYDYIILNSNIIDIINKENI